MSCPSAIFCAAVGSHGAALTFNGKSWSSPSSLDGPASAIALTSVSCPSAIFCIAVDGAGNAFTYTGSPTVASISPTSGTTAGGTTVTITGTGFTGATKVLFGTVAATSFTLVSSTDITAVSPAQAAGAHNIYVTNHFGRDECCGFR